MTLPTPDRPTVALVTVASGRRYVEYARRMLDSAGTHFLADGSAGRVFVQLEGRVGWPDATLYRYDVLLENAAGLEDATHVFMIDADMLFVAPVGREILAPLTATVHPGYIGRRGTYETRRESAAFVADDEGGTYFCGGFVGGERAGFLALADSLSHRIAEDARRGVTAVWHDESHLNRYLIDHPPAVQLSPSYCYPDDAERYVRELWPEPYEPRIVAVEKPRRFAFLRRWL